MTAKEFNEKYKNYLEEGYYGLAINIPSVVEYLDHIFEKELINITGFKYSQIKLKFNMCRFYFTTEQPNKSLEDMGRLSIEDYVNTLVKEYDASLNNK